MLKLYPCQYFLDILSLTFSLGLGLTSQQYCNFCLILSRWKYYSLETFSTYQVPPLVLVSSRNSVVTFFNTVKTWTYIVILKFYFFKTFSTCWVCSLVLVLVSSLGSVVAFVQNCLDVNVHCQDENFILSRLSQHGESNLKFWFWSQDFTVLEPPCLSRLWHTFV
jgi:hypothetical protein